MDYETHQIYDILFKKILTLSNMAVINLINGIFGTRHPTDSTVRYNWTEFSNNNLKRILADTIITIADRYSYHFEAQMYKDSAIVFRVFDYSYHHACNYLSSEEGQLVLRFPEPIIIFLCEPDDLPDTYSLILDFGTQGQFTYKVGTFKFLDISPKELDQKNMIILIPFELLKLRRAIKQERSEENKQKLIDLIQNDIIGSINRNFEAGNITIEDAIKLKRYTNALYLHIYSQYDELQEVTEMTDETLMFDIDYLEKDFEEKLAIYHKMEEDFEEKLAQYQKMERDFLQKEDQFKHKERDFLQKEDQFKHKERDFLQKEDQFKHKERDFLQKEDQFKHKERDFLQKEDQFKRKEQDWLNEKALIQKQLEEQARTIQELQERLSSTDRTQQEII